MSRDGSISFAWGDGWHRFRLAIGELRELQEKTDQGPEEVFKALETGTWRVNDIIETIRIGLIGGGADAAKARTLVQRYVSAGNLMNNISPAMLILAAAIAGVPDEAPKKAMGEAEMVPAHSPEENGGLPSSTATAP